MLSRRKCLQTMVGAFVGARSAGAVAARTVDEPAGAIKLGFSLYGMKSLAIADALRACSQIGYDGVELALMPGWPTDPKLLNGPDRKELRKQLKDNGLVLVSLMENLIEPATGAAATENLTRLAAASQLAHDLADPPPVIETILGGKPGQWDQVKDRLVERLKAWAEVAGANRTTIAIKPHVANALHTPEVAQRLVGQVNSPSIRLAYDFSHFTLRGLSMAKTMETLLPLSAFIHVKDARGNADKFEFLLPGDGDTDYVEYGKLVRAAGYRGGVVVEVSSQISNRRGYEPIVAAKRSYDTLAKAFRMAGLRR